MALTLSFHRHPEVDEVHCHVHYVGPEGDFVVRGRAKMGPLRQTLERLQQRYGTPKVAAVMGCACSHHAVSGEVDLIGCRHAMENAASLMGLSFSRLMKTGLKMNPLYLSYRATKYAGRKAFGRRQGGGGAPPLTDQSLDQQEQEQDAPGGESEQEQKPPSESEASGMFEIGDESTGFLPAAYYAYKQRRALAKVAKSGNPRAANAARTLAKAKGGDPVAKRKIRILNRAAKKGNPEAKDAMNRLNAVNKMTLLKPSFSFRDYYRAGIDQTKDSLKVPRRI